MKLSMPTPLPVWFTNLPTETQQRITAAFIAEGAELFEIFNSRSADTTLTKAEKTAASILRVAKSANSQRISDGCILRAIEALAQFCRVKKGERPDIRDLVGVALAWREGRTMTFLLPGISRPTWEIEIVASNEEGQLAFVRIVDGPDERKIHKELSAALNDFINDNLGGAWK